MDDSRLNELFTEFRKKYPKMDYFTQEEIFQYMRMAFHLGYDSKNDRHRLSNRMVVRGDGKEYKSVTEAAIINKIVRQNISAAINKGIKIGGYYWKYADKYHRIRK